MEDDYAQEPVSEEIKALYRKRQGELIEILKAIDGLEKNEDWLTLKTLVFDGILEKYKTIIVQEALNPEINPNKLYRFQGEMAWARSFADLRAWAKDLKQELESIKLKLR